MPLIRTCTFEDVRKQWASLCGLDHTSIGTDDANVFIELMNTAYVSAWVASEWNFAVDVTGFTLDSRSAIDLSSNSSVRDVLDAYDANPYYNSNARVMDYQITQNNVYVPALTATSALTSPVLTNSTTTATCTTSAEHGYSTNDTVVVSGLNESAYNGTFVITVSSTTVFTYTMASDPGGSGTGTPVVTQANVFLSYRTQETDFDGTLTTTLEYELKNFLAFQTSADWLAAEGQENKSLARQTKAAGHLIQAIDNHERQQQQVLPNRVGVRTVGIK